MLTATLYKNRSDIPRRVNLMVYRFEDDGRLHPLRYRYDTATGDSSLEKLKWSQVQRVRDTSSDGADPEFAQQWRRHVGRQARAATHG